MNEQYVLKQVEQKVQECVFGQLGLDADKQRKETPGEPEMSQLFETLRAPRRPGQSGSAHDKNETARGQETFKDSVKCKKRRGGRMAYQRKVLDQE